MSRGIPEDRGVLPALVTAPRWRPMRCSMARPRKCIDLAKAGDTTALRLCMERIAPVRKGRPVSVNLPPISTAGDVLGAIGATIEAMSQRDITPDEASVIAGVLEVKRKAIETVDLKARLSAVEAGLSREGKR